MADEIWLKARSGMRVLHEFRPFLIVGSELEEVYDSFGTPYRKDQFERVAPPPEAERLSIRRETPPVEYKVFQCEHRNAHGKRCEARPEPQKQRDPRFCWEHQPEGLTPICDHKWSTYLPCADCGPDPQLRKGVRHVAPDRKAPVAPR